MDGSGSILLLSSAPSDLNHDLYVSEGDDSLGAAGRPSSDVCILEPLERSTWKAGRSEDIISAIRIENMDFFKPIIWFLLLRIFSNFREQSHSSMRIFPTGSGERISSNSHLSH